MKSDDFNLGAELSDIRTRCDGILAALSEEGGRDPDLHVAQLLAHDIREAAERIELNTRELRDDAADALHELYDLDPDAFERIARLLDEQLELARRDAQAEPGAPEAIQ